jgi:hypothetical protein
MPPAPAWVASLLEALSGIAPRIKTPLLTQMRCEHSADRNGTPGTILTGKTPTTLHAAVWLICTMHAHTHTHTHAHTHTDCTTQQEFSLNYAPYNQQLIVLALLRTSLFRKHWPCQ